MITEIDEKTCSGCTACKAICNRNAITMKQNERGFLLPVIDEKICVKCGLCLKVCPLQSDSVENCNMHKSYGVINRNDAVRYKSTSGGFFPMLAELFIKEGGYVCGCILQDFKAVHVITNDWNIVIKMQGSKYIQSDMQTCFSQIAGFLKEKKKVLFTGTSCQVAGLKKYLQLKKIDDNGILYVDFFCHGVPSPMIFKDYVDFIDKKKKAINYYFRNKKYGWGKKSLGGDYLSFLEQRNGKTNEILYKHRLWRYIFFSNLVVRENCFGCRFSKVDKPSDITMADFWGIETIDKKFDDGKGCSLVISHTNKGESYINRCENADVIEVEINEAIKAQEHAFEPLKRNPQMDEFWGEYKIYGFNFIIKKYFNYTWSGRIKALIKYVLFKLHIRYLF